MKKYSLQQYKDLCRLAAKEEELIRKKKMMLYQMNVFGLKSTSVIEISSNSYHQDRTFAKLIRYNEIEAEINDSQRIVDLMLKTAEEIAPEYRIHVIDTYMIKDRRGKNRFPINEAERYGYDRRSFKADLDRAIEDALNREATIACLDQIRILAKKNFRNDYLEVFNEEK